MTLTTAWVQMILGLYPFSLATAAYQELSSTIGYRWAEGARIGRLPAQQFVGPQPRRFEISGVIHPHFRGGLRQIELMRLLADSGEPQLLIDGNGIVWGKYCVLAIGERKSAFLADGSPRQIDFDMSLIEYGEDAA